MRDQLLLVQRGASERLLTSFWCSGEQKKMIGPPAFEQPEQRF
jgi:hypothetical protein